MNTSPLLLWSHVVEKEMVLRMQYSGYSKQFRYQVVDSALKAYRVRQEADRDGLTPLYRSKGWKRKEREEQKMRKKGKYKKGVDEAVIFMPATPHSQLQKTYAEEVKTQGFKIKIVKRSGTT